MVCLAVLSSSLEEVLIQARQHQAIRHTLRAPALRLLSATLLQRGPAGTSARRRPALAIRAREQDVGQRLVLLPGSQHLVEARV